MTCIIQDDVGPGFTALFGYNDYTGKNARIQVGIPDNYLIRASSGILINGGQPQWFRAGGDPIAFTYRSTGEAVTWQLGNASAQATSGVSVCRAQDLVETSEGTVLRLGGKEHIVRYDPRKIAAGAIVGTEVNSVTGEVVDATPGTFEVGADGSANYRIPIATPPGRRGVEPRLALVYKSSAADSGMGQGWRLDGLSRITRCNQVVPLDGRARAIKFDAQDKFCLDGQPLVLIAGTHQQDGAEYRTQNDTFARIVAKAPDSLGPTYFEVRRKDGLIYTYGQTGPQRHAGVAEALAHRGAPGSMGRRRQPPRSWRWAGRPFLRHKPHRPLRVGALHGENRTNNAMFIEYEFKAAPTLPPSQSSIAPVTFGIP